MILWYRLKRLCEDALPVVQTVGVVVLLVTLLWSVRTTFLAERRFQEERDRFYEENRPRLRFGDLELRKGVLSVPIVNYSVIPARDVRTEWDFVAGQDTSRSYSRTMDIAGESNEEVQVTVTGRLSAALMDTTQAVEMRLMATYMGLRAEDVDTVMTILQYDRDSKEWLIKRQRSK